MEKNTTSVKQRYPHNTTTTRTGSFFLTRTNKVFEKSSRCFVNNCFNVRAEEEEEKEGNAAADDDANHDRNAFWPSTPDNTDDTPSCAQVERMSSSN